MSEVLEVDEKDVAAFLDVPRPRLSLVVPIYNEEEAIAPFFAAIVPVAETLSETVVTDIVFVNDGCTDDSVGRIKASAPAGFEISIVQLSRNFGKEAALFAGLAHARGDAVIPLDVDLQDPPEIIPEMVARWRAGAEMVNARRVSREQDNWLKRKTANCFYRVFNAVAEHPIPASVGDFRLLDRKVVDAICSLGERSRFNKALFSWVGFEIEEITFDRPGRLSGRSRWNYWKLWSLALDGIFSSSTMPLRIWSYVGGVLGVLSLAYFAFIVLRALLLGVDVPGYSSTVALILGFGAINLFALGIIGEYVGRIYIEVRQRPLFIVRSHDFITERSESRGS